MANPAFMEGIAAAKAGAKVLDNPYKTWESHTLWEIGFLFELERQCAS